MSIIEFNNVSFGYPNSKELALDGVNLAVEQGEFLVVAGSNGSGKSTLSLHMDALLRPTGGTVVVCGMDTADKKLAAQIRRNCALVFQNPDDQTVASVVEDDVAFGPENLGLPREEIRTRVDDALERVGLAGFQERLVADLSRGQRQRVAIAGALAMQPAILVCDEPCAMLDAPGRRAVMDVLKEVNAAGTTVVLITHDMRDASDADRIIVMSRGRIAMEGAPASVLQQENASHLFELGLELP